MSDKAIGVLDSGVGGLTVVKELMRQLPNEKIIYYGDTAHCPYGTRDLEQVRDFTFRIIDFLIQQDVKMIVIACNTATAASVELAIKKYDIPILGVIQPGVRAAIAATRNLKIGVIATDATIRSNVYQNTLHRINSELNVFSQACQPFVPIVEQNLVYTRDARKIIINYLEPIKQANIDTLILGCTHYPLMLDAISMFMGPDVNLISSADETARETIAILEQNNLLANILPEEKNKKNQYRFIVSGHPRPFVEIGKRWLDIEVTAEIEPLGIR